MIFGRIYGGIINSKQQISYKIKIAVVKHKTIGDKKFRIFDFSV